MEKTLGKRKTKGSKCSASDSSATYGLGARAELPCIPQESLFDALMDANTSESIAASLVNVQALLEKRACVDISWKDPKRIGVLSQMPQLVTLSPIPLACMQKSLDLIDLLIKYQGNVNEQVYSFKAGLLQREWKGNCTHLVVARNDVPFLKKLVERGAKLDLFSELGNASGANLVWQASYFGHADTLKYLLEIGVPSDAEAPSQDDDGIAGLYPMMVSARVGHAEVIEVLHGRRADVNITNRDRLAPIDCAIRNDEIELVKLLVSLKANIARETRNSQELKNKLGAAMTFNKYKRPLDRAFARNNSVLISAVAEGLAKSPEQAELLTHDDLLAFLRTPGEAPFAIMRSIFQGFPRKRPVQYCDETNKQRISILTAYLQDFNWGVLNTTVGPHPDVLKKMLLEKRAPDGAVKNFYNLLAPQQRTRVALHLNNVAIYRALVPNIHISPEILGAICDVKDETFFQLPAVQAYTEIHWQATVYVSYIRISVRICHVLAFIGVALVMNYYHSKCRLAACLTAPLLLCSIFEESILGFALGLKRLQQAASVLAWLQITFESWTLSYLVVTSPVDADGVSDLARAGAAFVVICHWARLLAKLAIFSIFGKEVLPILKAVHNLRGICIVSLFYILAFTHAYWSFKRYDLWDSFLQTWGLGVIGEFELEDLVNAPEIEEEEGDDAEQNSRRLEADPEMTELGTYIRIFFLCVSFWIFIVIVNIFIGILSNGYNRAFELAWPLYLKTRAHATVEAVTILQSVGLWRDSDMALQLHSEDDEDFPFMYYCIEEDSSSESDADQDEVAIRRLVRTQAEQLHEILDKSPNGDFRKGPSSILDPALHQQYQKSQTITGRKMSKGGVSRQKSIRTDDTSASKAKTFKLGGHADANTGRAKLPTTTVDPNISGLASMIGKASETRN